MPKHNLLHIYQFLTTFRSRIERKNRCQFFSTSFLFIWFRSSNQVRNYLCNWKYHLYKFFK